VADKSNPRFGEYSLLVLLSILWGASFSLIKVAVVDYPPATLVAIRMLVGGVLLTILAVSRGLAFPRSARRWLDLFIQGILQSALPFSLISWGEQHVPSALAGVLNSTVPMFVFVISVFVLKRAPFSAMKLLGVLLGLAGVVVMTGSSGIGQISAMQVLAVVAVMGASASYASGAIFGHRFDDQPAIITASGSLLCGSAVMVALSLSIDHPWERVLGWHATWAMLVLSVLSTALASVIFFRLIKTLGSLATTSNAYLRALFSVLFGVVFLSEPFKWGIVVATVLILAGVSLVTGQVRLGGQPARA